MQEKAREISQSLCNELSAFKASNGWLEKFRKRHNISYRVISGESASVSLKIGSDWIQRIPQIIEHDLHPIFNCDETGLFYKAMPDESLMLNKKCCRCGKKSKERMSILFYVSATSEEKLKSLVISIGLRFEY